MGMWNRVYRVNAKHVLNLRPRPSTDNDPLAKLERGQIVARLDNVVYAGNWFAVFADLSDRVVVGYVAAWLLEQLEPQLVVGSTQEPTLTDPHRDIDDDDGEIIRIPPEDRGDPESEVPAAAHVEINSEWASRTQAEWEKEWITSPEGSWRGTVGAAFTPGEFEHYVKTLNWPEQPGRGFMPRFITFHHTWRPSLSNRKNGFAKEHIRRLARGYRYDLDAKGGYQYDANGDRIRRWNGAPHLFVDDHKIWVLTPLTARGTHAGNFNSDSIGIEMLGNYHSLTEQDAYEQARYKRTGKYDSQEVDDFNSGRGLKVHQNAISAAASLLAVRGLDPENAVRFHRDDKHAISNGKKCPGGQVVPDQIVQELKTELARRKPSV